MSIRNRIADVVASTVFNRVAGLVLTPRRWFPVAKEDIKCARRILVLKPDEIGDVVLATGFMRTLRQACPNAHITIAIRSPSAPLVRLPELGDELLIWDQRWRTTWPFSIRNWLHLVLTARARFRYTQLDWVLIPRSCGDHMHMVLFAWWSGSRHICAHDWLCCHWGPDRRALVNNLIADHDPLHETSQHSRMLAHLGLPTDSAAPALYLLPEAISSANNELDMANLPKSVIALGVGAGAPSRRWPITHFQALVRELLAKRPKTGFVVIGDISNSEAGEVIRQIAPHRVANFAGRLTLLQSAALLGRCRVYVGNDSGPMHLAAAAGCAIVEISKHPIGADDRSSNSPLRFGPIAASMRILRPAPIDPACAHGCEHAEAHCIKAVGVNTVAEATIELL